MTRNDILAEVQQAFAQSPRPAMFIRGTCRCEECMEHEAEMQSMPPDDLPLDKLDKPGWDPICFASNAAFVYLMPGLGRLLLEHVDEYVQQFVFHIGQPERLEIITPAQAQAVVHLLDYLVLHEAEALDNNLVADEVEAAREKFAQRAAERI